MANRLLLSIAVLALVVLMLDAAVAAPDVAAAVAAAVVVGGVKAVGRPLAGDSPLVNEKSR